MRFPGIVRLLWDRSHGVACSSREVAPQVATVSFRTESGVTEDEPWKAVSSAVLSSTAPWRKFRW